MPKLIELRPDESAEPGKCGSCEWFARSEWVGPGSCRLILPPHAAIKASGTKVNEDYRDPTLTYDTGSCSFYRSSDAEFSKKISWTVTQNVRR